MSHLDEGQLHELLDGELDEPARGAALAHLASCERCKAAYDEAAAFLAEADSLVDAVQLPTRAAEPPSRENAEPPSRPAAKPGLRTLAWAASLILAVGIGWYGSDLRRSVAPAESIATGGEVAGQVAAAPAVTQPAPADEAHQAGRAATQAAPKPERQVARQPEPLVSREDRRAKEVGNVAPVAEESGLGLDAADQVAAGPPPAAPAPAAAAPAAPTPSAEAMALKARRNEAVASADLAARGYLAPALFRAVAMEEAVRILGGSIRLIDGMTPTRVLTGNPTGITLVRVVYEDPPGRELWLDQSRAVPSEGERARSATTLLQGDTLVTRRDGGSRSLSWVDQNGFQLRLTGYLGTDSLTALQARVR